MISIYPTTTLIPAGYGWCVRRTENVEIAGRPFTCIGDFMTEVEACTCVTALNDHDRKVRAVRQS